MTNCGKRGTEPQNRPKATSPELVLSNLGCAVGVLPAHKQVGICAQTDGAPW